MNKNTRLIILIVLAILIVVVLTIGFTRAFLKPVVGEDKVVEVSISSCAKIKLEDTSSISLSNTYPMSRNRGFQTTPYTFTVTSSCDTAVGFNLYLATLESNTLDASSIHYIVTKKDSKVVLAEGTLSSDVSSTFTDTDKTELNAGLGGTYGSIYKLYNSALAVNGSSSYDLYLYVDEDATISTASQTFVAGVAIKSHDVTLLSDYVKSLYTGTQGDNSIYYHDGTITSDDGTVLDAGDNSYRYAGASADVDNYVCFGSDEDTCPTDNLYRIIGVFNQIEDGKTVSQVKLIKSTSIGSYDWDSNISNTWSTASLNTYLNGTFISGIDSTWSKKIAETTWKVGGNTYANIVSVVPATAYQNEIPNAVTTNSTDNATTYSAKIGLMYVTDYEFAASPSAWTLYGHNVSDSTKDYSSATSINWMYLGSYEWTISRSADYSYFAFFVDSTGYVSDHIANGGFAVRPVFYLTSAATYLSGQGTSGSPIRLG